MNADRVPVAFVALDDAGAIAGTFLMSCGPRASRPARSFGPGHASWPWAH